MSAAEEQSELIPITQNGSTHVKSDSNAEKTTNAKTSSASTEKAAAKGCGEDSSSVITFPAVNFNRHEIFAAVGPCLSAVLAGFSNGFTSSSISDLLSEDRLTVSQANWFASLFYLGALGGGVAFAILSNSFGRKLSLMFSAVVAAIGWWMIVADLHVSFLLIGRTFCGIHAGLHAVLSPMYVVETIREETRDTFTTLIGVTYNAGMLLCFLFRLFLFWRWLTVVALCNCIIFIFIMSFMPETPRWYLIHRRPEDAKKSLMWFRMVPESMAINTELATMEQSFFTHQQQTSLSSLFKERKYRQPLLLGVLLMSAMPLSCYYAIISFIWQIAEDVHISSEANLTVYIGLLQLIVGLVMTTIVHTAKRRIFLGVGGVFATVSLFLLGFADFFQRQEWVSNTKSMTILGLVMYFICYNIGWNVCSALIMNEILPNTIRSTGSGTAVGVKYLLSFVTTQAFRPLEASIFPFGTFFAFATVNLGVTVVLLYFLPETKSKTLESIEEYFQ